MARKKIGTKPDHQSVAEPGKQHDWPQRKKKVQSVAAYRDLAKWLTAIAAYATDKLREKGVLKGKEQISVARLVDPMLRDWAFVTYRRIRNIESETPDAPIPAVPPPPERVVDMELPGLSVGKVAVRG